MASYKEFLEMSPKEVQSLNKAELSKVVAQLNRIEHKRLKNLEKYGLQGPALTTLIGGGGKTRAGRDMSINELRAEYKRAKSFLQSETSTVKGARQFIQGIKENIGAEKAENLTGEDIGRLYSILDKYKETGAIGFYKKGSKRSAGYSESIKAQETIYDLMKQGKTDDEILSSLGALDESTYEAMQDTSTDFQWTGDYRP